MKKIILSTIIGIFAGMSAYAYSGGNGIEQNPYLISSKADMEQLATNVNGGQTYSGIYFLLTRDLTGVNDTVTTVVGISDTYFFSGIFDGGGHKIAVKITRSFRYAGLFGCVSGASIKNLGVSGNISSSYSSSNSYSGGVCGYVSNGGSSNTTISNCYNTGNISSSPSSYYYSGGICGYAGSSSYTTISNCYNTGNISSNSYYSYSGGISGWGGTIKNCFVANCSISNSGDIVRTRIGRIGGDTTGSYENCYALDTSVLINGDPLSNLSENSKDGKDTDLSSLQSQSWLSSTLLWDFDNAWRVTEGTEFPTFKNVFITLELPEIVYGDQISLNGTSNNTTTPIIYTSSDNVVAEIAGSLLIAKKAGEVSITASQPADNGYFAGNATIRIIIGKKELNVKANPASMIYGDAVPVYTCQYSGFLSGDTENMLSKLPGLTCGATSQSNAGKYAITPSGAEAGNYSFTYQTDTLTIQKRALQIIPGNASRIYGYANPAFELSYEGFVNGDTSSALALKPTVSTTATINSHAGEYDITCSGGNATNYDFVYKTGKLQITKAPLTVSAGNASRNYGSDNQPFSLTYSGFRNSETQTVLTTPPQAVCTATKTSNAGTYPITVSGGTALNYDFNYVSGTLTINKVAVTVVARSVSSLYGEVPQYTCQYIGFVNDETESVLTTLPTLTCSATSQSNAGQYAVTPAGAQAENYTFTYLPGTLTIQKRSLLVTPGNASRMYGEVNPAFELSYAGFVNGDNAADIATKPVVSTAATPYSSVGEYGITVSGGTALNYDFSYASGILTVNKAKVNVTAHSVSSVYGDEIPQYTCQYSGFANGETESVLTQRPTLTCNANSQSRAGQYTVTPAGAEAQNYTFSYQTGTLQITKAPLTISANNASRPQGTANPSFSLAYAGFKNNETESVLDQLPAVSCAANLYSPAGFYDIVLSGGTDHNYEYRLINGKLEVMPTTGLVETQHVPSLRVYPNPVKDYLSIQSDVPIEKVELYNTSGVCVLRDEHFTEKAAVSHLANGVYIVRIYAEGAAIVKKIIVEK